MKNIWSALLHKATINIMNVGGLVLVVGLRTSEAVFLAFLLVAVNIEQRFNSLEYWNYGRIRFDESDSGFRFRFFRFSESVHSVRESESGSAKLANPVLTWIR